MNSQLTHLIDSLAGLKVVVIGEAMLDSYLEGQASRISREAPVPIVTLSGRKDVPGGAANTAANVRSMGGHPAFLSVIGDDPEGTLLRHALEAVGVSTEHLLVHPERRTLAKHRVLASSQMLLRFDQGSTGPVDTLAEQRLVHCLEAMYPQCDAVIVSDYGYGILTPKVIHTLRKLQLRHPRVLVADAKDLSRYRRVGVTAVKPNYSEFAQLLGQRPVEDPRRRAEVVTAQGRRILDVTGSQMAAVTLDAEGAVVLERGSPPYRTYAHPARHSQAAGAGDTFVAALALALAAGSSTPAAAELASAAASFAVGKEGTATCSSEELREYAAAEGKYVSDLPRLVSRVEFYRQQGRRIAFTNGCFDIIHRGHITYLNRAKALGDVLIVGVNADASVRRLKGPGRPINTLEDRVQVLAAMSSVDHIIAFQEDTPSEVIRAIRPDVFVKGGDYTWETLPEAPLVEALGGTVHILPYVEEHSTTSIIQRIRDTYSRKRRDSTRQQGGSSGGSRGLESRQEDLVR